MNSLRRLDDRPLGGVDDLARHTGWLHGAIVGCATYGLVLFAAAGWSALATLIAGTAGLTGVRTAFGPVSTPA